MESQSLYSKLKSFEALSVFELYEILRLRSEVFAVEQNCIFLDPDDKDQKCHHLMLFSDGKLAGFSRIVPKGLSFSEVSIGRVITSPSVRGTGLGRKLMELSVQACGELFGKQNIRIGAQVYAQAFYASLGFEPTGEIYDEDGIDHIDMIKPASNL